MYKTVLVPVSFDEDRDAAGAIGIARALCAEGGTVHLLHVVESIPGYAMSYVPKDYLVEARRAIAAELSKMAAPIGNAESHVVEGHSGRTILDWAETHKVDCIVIASHRPGMQDLLLGSTATTVVRHSPCSVHVIR